ncbi:phage portal protein [Vibrio vulnificus]|nr:phage portal protein [Vibrio vulnificus]
MFITKSFNPYENSPALKSFISGSGAAVTYETALQDPTVKACVRVIAQTISTLPLKLYKQQTTGVGKEYVEDSQSQMAHALTLRPNPRQTTPEFIEQMIVQLAVFSEFYAKVTKTPAGKVIRVTPFNSPKQVSVQEVGDSLEYHCVTNEGKSEILKPEEVLYIRDLSLNTFQAMDKINLAKSSIGLSLSATRNAEDYYKKGSRAGGFIKVQGKLSDDAYARLSRQVNEHYAGTENAHKIGILEGDSTFVENAYSLKNSQVLESRNASVREIAALFGVPISLLGISDPNMKDIETINSFFYKSCLQSILTKIEARFRLILPHGYYLHFDTSEYLKGDVRTQADVAEKLFTRGLISRNEARRRMGLQKDTPQEVYVVSSNNLVFGSIDGFFNQPQQEPTSDPEPNSNN